MAIQFIDLCSGIGGFHSGLMATGHYECVGHAEVDPHASKAYAAMVLSSLPDIEIACTDSSECFDDNKAYLHTRLDEERNPKVKRLLKRDIEFLDQIQVEMATARQFLFIARCKAKKPEQVFQTANRVEKVISEQGFEVRRMKKEDIKRFLALYFDASFNGEQMPDIDGEQFFEVNEDDEET